MTIPQTDCPCKTLKAAYADGWVEVRPEHYAGERMELKGHILTRNPKVAVSKTEWGCSGYRVRDGESPHGQKLGRINSRWAEWDVYREDQVEPKRQVHSTPARAIDVLAAVWTVNRHAKRCRDAAASCYAKGTHAFAGANSAKKSECYRVKSQALHHLLAGGRLAVVGYHRFGENWAEVLSGEGYTFHRPCPEPPAGVEAKELDGIEAKPRAVREPRLKDALLTVKLYLEGRPEAEVYQWDRRPRVVSYVQEDDHDYAYDYGGEDWYEDDEGQG